VGVGYKDKGNKKNAHLDGTQSWQEVAASKLESHLDHPLRTDPKRYYSASKLNKFSG
jgi:hypothetical protein